MPVDPWAIDTLVFSGLEARLVDSLISMGNGSALGWRLVRWWIQKALGQNQFDRREDPADRGLSASEIRVRGRSCRCLMWRPSRRCNLRRGDRVRCL